MTVMSTRTAPVGAMMSGVLARATTFGGCGGLMTASTADTAPSSAAPAPAAPSTPADTAARLDAQDTQLADHEARIAGLEQRLPPPAVDTGAQAAPPAASAAAATPVTRMVSSAEIYGRMNARTTGLKAASHTPPALAVIQTSAGPVLNARVIHDRHNAAAALRVRRPLTS